MLGSNLCAVVIVKPGNEVWVSLYYLYFHATGIKTSPTVLHTRRRCTGRCTREEAEILDNVPSNSDFGKHFSLLRVSETLLLGHDAKEEEQISNLKEEVKKQISNSKEKVEEQVEVFKEK